MRWRGIRKAVTAASRESYSRQPRSTPTYPRREMTRRALTRTLTVLALSVAGCGGDEKSTEGKNPQRPGTEQAPAIAKGVDEGDVRVVRAWSDALRRGDVDAAVRYFAVPSRAANGTGPIQLASKQDVRAFNEALPCGARLIAGEPADDGFFIATFVLTERPGPGTCGLAKTSTARTAFRVKDGRITDWLRVGDLPMAPRVDA